MSDLMRRAASYYDASYPPDLFGPPPTPVLVSLNPTSIVAGQPPVALTITGTGFTPNSKVWADEAAQLTQDVDSTTLIYGAQASAEGTQTITVKNGSIVSNAIELTVDPQDTLTEEDQPEAEATEESEPEPEATNEPEPEPEPDVPEGYEKIDPSGGTGPKRRRPR